MKKVTAKEIQKAMEKLITISCEMEGKRTPREIAERALELNAGTKREREVLDYILKNVKSNNLDYHFKYVE